MHWGRSALEKWAEAQIQIVHKQVISCGTTLTCNNQPFATYGKPLLRKSAGQMEFYRKGGGGENSCQMDCGISSVNENHFFY